MPETPAIIWEFAPDQAGDAYVATMRAGEGREPEVVLRLPRNTVDSVVLNAASIVIELKLDGSVAAYAGCGTLRTLSSAPLGSLVGDAISADALGGEDKPAGLAMLEAALSRALETVRHVRR